MLNTSMKKSLKAYIVVAILVLAFSFYAGADSRKLIVGVSAEYPPFIYIKKGEVVGFDIDLINYITTHLNYKVKIRDMEFNELFAALENKEIDVAISAISVNKERENKVYFSNRYYFPKFTMLYNIKSRIYSTEELQGKTIGAVSGTVMEKYLIKKFSIGRGIKTEIFANRTHMLNALLKGKIDAVITEDGWAKITSKTYNNFLYIIIKDAPSKGYAIAFQKNSPLTDKFNDELVALKTSAQFSILRKKWGLD